VKEAINAVAPGLVVEERSVFGPPTSMDLRAVGWAEATILLAGAAGATSPITSPEGAVAEASFGDDGSINVKVQCGEVLDEVVLRSYCIGAAHMALSWLTSEGLAVDDEGEVHDLTVRSFGVLRAVDTPHIDVEIVPGEGPALNGSDAVFVAVAAAGWLRSGCVQDWPIRVSL
jgi:CO/xanthine dehydrogenase Mo-binding subunit